MAPTPWDQLREELERLYADPNCKQLRPLLDSMFPLVGVKESPEAVQTMLTVVKQRRDGSDPHMSLHEQAAGIVNETIKGQVLQAQTQNIVIHAIERAKPEMKLVDPGIEVDFVLLVMTAKEAQDLAAGNPFAGEPEVLKHNLERLVLHLEQTGKANWVKYYGATAGEWHPRGGARDIAGYISDALTTFNKANEKSKEFTKPFTPIFHDIRTLDRLTLGHLRERCIVVVDAISIRHPALLRAYQRSMLDVFPNTSVVTLTPDGNAFEVMKSMVHSLQTSLEESEFNQRLLDPLGDLACQHCSETEMSQWLLTRVRKLWASAAGRAGVRASLRGRG